MNSFLVFFVFILSVTVAFLVVQARDHYKQKQTEGSMEKDDITDISKLVIKASLQPQPLLQYEDVLQAQFKFKNLLIAHNNSMYDLAEYLNLEHGQVLDLKESIDVLKEKAQKVIMKFINEGTENEFDYDLNKLAKISG